MPRSLLWAALLVLGACASGTAQVPVATTADGSRVLPLSAPAGHEAVVTEAEFTPGQEIPAHRHPGTEIAYGIAGETMFQFEGELPRLLKPGESILIPAGTYHRAKAGPAGAKILILRIHPVGQPLRIAPDRPVRFPE